MSILALSSAESELAAIIKSCGEGLGIQSLLADFGVSTTLTIKSDASAAIGICKRLGLGRVRHLATGDLWIQQLLRHKKVAIEKCPTEINPSDLLTKGLARERIQSLLQIMSMQAQGGRAPLAPIRGETTPFYGPTMIEDIDSDTGF